LNPVWVRFQPFLCLVNYYLWGIVLESHLSCYELVKHVKKQEGPLFHNSELHFTSFFWYLHATSDTAKTDLVQSHKDNKSDWI
jgi:hypothetical protein